MIAVAGSLLTLVALPGAAGQEADAPCDGPQNVAATATAEGNVVTWDVYSFAHAYEVWRATGDGPFVEIGATQGDHPETPGGDHDTDFLDEDVVAGETYTYQVRALATPPNVSEFCGSATVTAIPFFPGLASVVLASVAVLGAYGVQRRRTR